MQIVERSVLVIALLISGLLLFTPASRSREDKAPIALAANNSCEATPAAQGVNNADKKPALTFVANPFCRACHFDFDEEELALDHEVFGIGCERCHGESFRHRSDEANLTPPEIMYAKERINPSCMSCHPRQAIQDTKDHDPILEAGLSSFEGATPSGKDAKKYCTDCHGSKHRVLRVRATHWDKATGALLQKSN
jgi:hypothetical protein